MAEKRLQPDEESKQDVVEKSTEKNVPQGIKTEKKFDMTAWKPHTVLGKQVKANKIKNIDEILNEGKRILEPQIIEVLLPNIEHDLIMVGQSKGKFGGGKRNIWKQSQKKTKESNKPSFATLAVVGNKDGYVGIGYGKARETVPAREKAVRRAKLNLIKIRRGCGSWECGCAEPHSIPFKVEGKSGSVKIKLFPAPKGTNLCIEKECRKVLEFAGIKDVYSKTFGQTRIKLNLIKACFSALKKLSKVKIQPKYIKSAGVIE